MSLMLHGATSSSRSHHTNAILGGVGIAFSSHSRDRRERDQQQYGSQETLSNAGTTAVYKMISPAADILTRLGVDHVIIGLLCILLQILLDWINYHFTVYSCDLVGPHLAHSNAGILFGLFYIFLGTISVKVGGFTRNSSGAEAKRRFTTFHLLNFVNFIASLTFLLASSILLYVLWLRLNSQGCHGVDWEALVQPLNLGFSNVHANDSTSAKSADATFVATKLLPSIKKLQQEDVNEYEFQAAVVCSLVVNGFLGVIGTLELLMTLVGCCLRPS